MHRMRAAGFLALASFGFLLAPASATTPTATATLRLTGRSTAYTDITLTRPTRLDGARATLDVRGGTYVGWWLSRRGETPTPKGNQAGGLRWVAHDPQHAVQSTSLALRTEPLEPGVYRLYLATDGNAVVTIPATGLSRSMSVTPRTRVASGARSQPLTVAAGVVHDDVRTRLALPATALVATSVLAVAEPGVTIRSMTACMTAPGKDCAGATATTGYTSSLMDHGVQFTTLYPPGQLPPGPADAVHAATGGPRIYQVWASYFYLGAVM